MNNFHLIKTPMPPMLPDMMGVSAKSRYLGLFYQATNPTWTDGESTATFSFYQCWQPLSAHPAIRIPLALVREDFMPTDEEWCEVGFGSDDCPPTHLLLVDTVDRKMTIATWKEGHQFLVAQHPPRPSSTPEQQKAELAAVLALYEALDANPTMREMNRRGMFEMFSTPDPQLAQQRQQMIEFLDRHLDPEIKRELQRFKLG